MLVIRELLLGPKRFKSLLAALPGIGGNRLSDRLKGLEEAGIIRRTTLPAPAAVTAYELTGSGRAPTSSRSLPWAGGDSICRSTSASTRRPRAQS